MSGPPNLSADDRARALEKAGEAALARGRRRAGRRRGAQSHGGVRGPPRARQKGGIKVKAVLTALPGLGKVKSYRLMETIGIAENRRLRGLGPKQREALLAALS